MKNSPMFKHAIESFEHGLEHYLDGTERSRKFALLHLDQAVELFLKEKIVQLGKSIYKSDGSTLSLYESFNSLKLLNIPERPRLEEAHDLRNTVQHKGLTPDPSSTEFYVKITYDFIKRFLLEELNTNIEEVITARYRALIEGQPISEEDEIKALLQGAKSTPSTVEKIILGYTALHRASTLLKNEELGIVGFRRVLRETAKRKGTEPEQLKPFLESVMSLRNKVMHSEYIPSKIEADLYLKSTREILKKAGILIK